MMSGIKAGDLVRCTFDGPWFDCNPRQISYIQIPRDAICTVVRVVETVTPEGDPALGLYLEGYGPDPWHEKFFVKTRKPSIEGLKRIGAEVGTGR